MTDIDSAGLKIYGYDDALRIISITDSTDPSLSQSYGYDLLDRLTSASGTSLNQGWTYDPNGNRLSQSGSQTSSYTIASTNNRISSISGPLNRSYSYDNAGHTTSDGTTTFTYNDAGRLISTTQAGTTTVYALNALGQRVKKTANGASTYFVYDEAGHLIGEYDGTGNLIQETVWFGDIPVAVLKPNGSGGVNHFYLHTDHLNTPQKISRSSDNVIIWRWDSDPFGTTAANEDPDGDAQLFTFNLRFPGSYADSETGLLYNWHRSLDPQAGRYTTSDPIGLQGGLNTYAYANGNPISNFDPDGLVVRGRGCTGKGWAKIQDAERRTRKELEKGCECTPNSQGSCIPCDIRPQLLRALDTSMVNCSYSDTYCATGATPGSYVNLMRPAFSDPGCGCVALTLYHELLHNTGLRHDPVNPMDAACKGNLCK